MNAPKSVICRQNDGLLGGCFPEISVRPGRTLRPGQEVLERSGVITQDRPLPHAEEPAALNHDDVPRLEEAGGFRLDDTPSAGSV